MDVVVAQGLLAETCLLKLSTASRGTVTQAARHKAMKLRMTKLWAGRIVKNDFQEKRNYHVSKVLAAIVVGDNLVDSRQTAMDALTVCAGEVLPHTEVVRRATAHWQQQRDLASDNDDAPNVEESEVEFEVESEVDTSEEEPLEEDPVNEGPVEGAVVEQQ